MLRNEGTEVLFSKKTLGLLQIHNLNTSIHNTGLFRNCLFFLKEFWNFYWTYISLAKSQYDILKTSFLRKSLFSLTLLNNWSGNTYIDRPRINNPLTQDLEAEDFIRSWVPTSNKHETPTSISQWIISELYISYFSSILIILFCTGFRKFFNMSGIKAASTHLRIQCKFLKWVFFKLS